MCENISSDNSEKILLEGDFLLHPKPKPKFHITVTASRITCAPKTVTRQGSESSQNSGTKPRRTGSIIDRRLSMRSTSDDDNGDVQSISLDDVIGCDCQKGRDADQSNVAYLCVYSYPHRKQLLSKVTLRKRTTLTLTLNQCATFGENFQEGLRWKHILGCLLNKSSMLDVDVNSWAAAPEKKFLVLVNPFSGPGKALKIFQERIFPMFAEADVKHHMVVTKHAGHAKEIVKALFINDWYGIVIVSGDGLIFETINGLMERHDWDRAIKLPIGALPGGSGNAMAAAVLHSAGEPYLDNFVCHSTFSLIKHDVTPLDLAAVDTCTSKRLYSFLAVAWGMISDVDIGSEKYRSLGNSRFAVEAVSKIASLRKYRGRLSFLPVDGFTPKTGFNFQTSDSAMSQNVPIGSATNDMQMSSTINTNTNSTENTLNLKLDNSTSDGIQSNVHDNGDRDGVPELSNSGDIPISISNETSASADPVTTGSKTSRISTPLLPGSINDPVPSHWLTVEDEFVTVIASLQTHLSVDSIVAPAARFDDGFIHLAYVRAGISRFKLVQMFSAMEEGRVIDDPHLQLVQVRAFRLVPLTEGGTLTVDGELVDYGSIQAQVLPGLGRFMV